MFANDQRIFISHIPKGQASIQYIANTMQAIDPKQLCNRPIVIDYTDAIEDSASRLYDITIDFHRMRMSKNNNNDALLWRKVILSRISNATIIAIDYFKQSKDLDYMTRTFGATVNYEDETQIGLSFPKTKELLDYIEQNYEKCKSDWFNFGLREEADLGPNFHLYSCHSGEEVEIWGLAFDDVEKILKMVEGYEVNVSLEASICK